jgi:hypothetical protein
VDPKVLDTYLGVWRDAPAPSTVTFTRDGGKLMARGTNGTDKTELLALSDNTFVLRGDSTLITFEKGPDGKVTRTLLRDLGGSVQVHESRTAYPVMERVHGGVFWPAPWEDHAWELSLHK